MVRIAFDLDGLPAEFRWNNITGMTELVVAEQSTELQSPLNPATHFSMALKRTWQRRVADHDVEIEKVRPLFFGAVRPNVFTVRIDGVVVAQAKGI